MKLCHPIRNRSLNCLKSLNRYSSGTSCWLSLNICCLLTKSIFTPVLRKVSLLILTGLPSLSFPLIFIRNLLRGFSLLSYLVSDRDLGIPSDLDRLDLQSHQGSETSDSTNCKSFSNLRMYARCQGRKLCI